MMDNDSSTQTHQIPSSTPPIGGTTIYALASGSMHAGVAVIRVSGPGALQGLGALINDQAIPAPRYASLRKITHPTRHFTIDQALALTFPAPHSFTGEDVVEYHLHGGRAVIESLFDALGAMADHRMAEPGEFTRRAFENGKMDLTEAEAIHDLICAQTEAQQVQALDQLDGGLSKIYESWRADLIKAAAYLEATIDFADEDLPEDDIAAQVLPQIHQLHQDITQHLSDNRRGEILRDGIKIAILGAPNAGKSSLVNALAQRDVCIVSDMAGTTRDIIEVHLNIGGYPVIISDTAGLRPDQLSDSAQDRIEDEGIARALKIAQKADLKILLFDGGDLPHLHADTLKLLPNEDSFNALVVINKSDQIPPNLTRPNDIPSDINGQKTHYICVKTNHGMDDFLSALKDKIDHMFHRGAHDTSNDASNDGHNNAPNIMGPTQARHRDSLTRADQALKNIIDQSEHSANHALPPELLAEELRAAARAIGAITGRIDVENLLDVIFRDFCIGK